MEQLTPQEEQLMRYVWARGKGFIKDYREMYPDSPKPPYTTVATIMKKLENKGYVASRLYGNTYEYRPKIRADRYKSEYVDNAVTNFFQNSYKELVSFFAREEKLTEKDLAEIIQLIKKEKR
ncbi:MAG: BlaI/MecI/CopY family transcriptional regulator [Dysgonamonadaceae bacterium]|jgi:predicted transcriptional regulator|nr:BlaI/MecI/CopY family transcriptional regulator [Dysgonamonadaceae bacterium]